MRRERERALIEKEGKDLPFGLYLVLSGVVAIAAVRGGQGRQGGGGRMCMPVWHHPGGVCGSAG